jgi:immunity protein 21 of polymorphic toxin system
MGVNGLSSFIVPGTQTDYDRACATIDYVSVIPCGGSNVLVLGDEPLQSSFIQTRGGCVIVARWVYAQAGQDVNSILASSLGASESSDRVYFKVQKGELILFDSALSGSSVLAESSNIFLHPGLYQVTTEPLELKQVYSFLLHRFVKID